MLIILQVMPSIRGGSYLTGYWIVINNVKDNVHEPGTGMKSQYSCRQMSIKPLLCFLDLSLVKFLRSVRRSVRNSLADLSNLHMINFGCYAVCTNMTHPVSIFLACHFS